MQTEHLGHVHYFPSPIKYASKRSLASFAQAASIFVREDRSSSTMLLSKSSTRSAFDSTGSFRAFLKIAWVSRVIALLLRNHGVSSIRIHHEIIANIFLRHVLRLAAVCRISYTEGLRLLHPLQGGKHHVARQLDVLAFVPEAPTRPQALLPAAHR